MTCVQQNGGAVAPASGKHPQAIPANGHDAAPGGGGRGRSTGPSRIALRYQYWISVVVDSGGSSIPDKELILRLGNNPGIQYRLTSPLGVLVAWAVTLAPPLPQRPPLITPPSWSTRAARGQATTMRSGAAIGFDSVRSKAFHSNDSVRDTVEECRNNSNDTVCVTAEECRNSSNDTACVTNARPCNSFQRYGNFNAIRIEPTLLQITWS